MSEGGAAAPRGAVGEPTLTSGCGGAGAAFSTPPEGVQRQVCGSGGHDGEEMPVEASCRVLIEFSFFMSMPQADNPYG